MARIRALSWSIPAASAAGAVAAAISVAVLVGGSGRSPEPSVHRAALRVELFQPLEPNIAPGSVMDVGPVVDGYVHRPVSSPSPVYVETAWLEPEPAYEPPTPLPRAYVGEVAQVTSSAPRSSTTPGPWSRAFGFDNPQPEYAEARRQREIELDQRAAERSRITGQPASLQGPEPRPAYEPAETFF